MNHIYPLKRKTSVEIQGIQGGGGEANWEGYQDCGWMETENGYKGISRRQASSTKLLRTVQSRMDDITERVKAIIAEYRLDKPL